VGDELLVRFCIALYRVVWAFFFSLGVLVDLYVVIKIKTANMTFAVFKN